MQVFKAYLKIIYSDRKQLLSFAVIFIALALGLIFIGRDSEEDFEGTRCSIAFINYDEGSVFVEELKNYLGESNDIIDIPDEEVRLQDALFYREVEFIVKVPEGFTESFLNGGNPQLLKNSVPDSNSAYYVEMLINRYLNAARVYIDTIDGLDNEQLVELTVSGLSDHAQIIMKQDSDTAFISEAYKSFSNFILYPIFIIAILGSGAAMYVFLRTEVRERNLVSPMKIYRLQGQLIMGNLVYALIVWGVFALAAMIFLKKAVFTPAGLLVILNMLICVLVAISTGYLLANLIKGRSAVSSAANLIGLGSAFLGGAFVGQDLMSGSVLRIASFMPGYWYVKANNEIIDAAVLNADTLKPIFMSMLIQGGFAVMFLVVTMVYVKNRRTVKAL